MQKRWELGPRKPSKCPGLMLLDRNHRTGVVKQLVGEDRHGGKEAKKVPEVNGSETIN